MAFLVIWGCLSFVVAFVWGVARTIGFWGSFILSLLLSPIAGLIITLCFKTKEAEKREKEMLQLQRQMVEMQKKQANS